jgi:hypothetical protein
MLSWFTHWVLHSQPQNPQTMNVKGFFVLFSGEGQAVRKYEHELKWVVREV